MKWTTWIFLALVVPITLGTVWMVLEWLVQYDIPYRKLDWCEIRRQGVIGAILGGLAVLIASTITLAVILTA